MKKILLLILSAMALALCIGTRASAQEHKKHKMSVGGYYAMGSGPSFGVGGKFQFLVTDHFRLEASPAVHFSGEPGIFISILDLGVHAHYRFSVGSIGGNKRELPAYIYPLAGLGVYRIGRSGEMWTFDRWGRKISVEDISTSETKIGADLGAGFEFYIPNKRLSWFMEMKMGIGKDFSRFTALWGIAYHF